LDLQVLLRELQGANYRIGYLESENNTYQKQVLMLPDLESEAKRAQDQDKELQELRAELDRLKGSWWYRFTRFLSGGR
jgi:cell shape-determining protein MreC